MDQQILIPNILNEHFFKIFNSLQKKQQNQSSGDNEFYIYYYFKFIEKNSSLLHQTKIKIQWIQIIIHKQFIQLFNLQTNYKLIKYHPNQQRTYKLKCFDIENKNINYTNQQNIKIDSMKQTKVDIDTIMREFDQYVEESLQKKQSNDQPQPVNNQLDQYYQSMQKRLKIKTITQDQKFQNMLGPMKKLKSFVSIKEFLKGLNQKPTKNNQNQPNIMSQNTKRKLQYEDLRGGLYMQKVQNHLRRNHLKRKLDSQAEFLLKELEQNQSQKNQYRTWMENVLGKINMKEQSFLRPSQSVEIEDNQKLSSNNFIFTDITNTDIKKTKKQNYKRRMSQEKEQKNFKKVSNFLAQRLRKILTDKYVNNSSKQNKKNKQMLNQYNNFDDGFKMVTQPSTIGVTYRKTVCRTTATSKRMRQSVGNLKSRAQTTQLRNRKAPDDIWKKKLNNKMDDIMNEANNYYKKGQQDKKQYRNIINPFWGLAQDGIQK